MNPRLYLAYKPNPNRTLIQRRTWRERFLDLRHATGLSRRELGALMGLDPHQIQKVETLGYKTRMSIHTILSIRRMEAIFKEELERYLRKPHGLLRYREQARLKLLPFGGYGGPTHARTAFRTVSFGSRTFADIQEMDDLEAIRALKVVREPRELHSPLSRFTPRKEGNYYRVLEAASRGHFMSIAEIARVVGSDSEAQPGQPVDGQG